VANANLLLSNEFPISGKEKFRNAKKYTEEIPLI
jgi:hypothetical protein